MNNKPRKRRKRQYVPKGFTFADIIGEQIAIKLKQLKGAN